MNIQDNVRSIWSKELIKSAEIPVKAEVVIIGGGIVGVSTAYFLAKQGIDVCLCEKGHISGEQSGRNWGWVRVQGRDEREIPMMLKSLDIWRNLSNDLGEDVGYREDGCLYTAYTEKELSNYQDWVDLAKDFNIKTDFISGSELKSAAGMASRNWVGGIVTKSDGRAEPQKAS